MLGEQVRKLLLSQPCLRRRPLPKPKQPVSKALMCASLTVVWCSGSLTFCQSSTPSKTSPFGLKLVTLTLLYLTFNRGLQVHQKPRSNGLHGPVHLWEVLWPQKYRHQCGRSHPQKGRLDSTTLTFRTCWKRFVRQRELPSYWYKTQSGAF